MSTKYKKESALKGLFRWFGERFPVLNVVSSFLLFYFLFCYVTNVEGRDFNISIKEHVLPWALLSQLLFLRILDEFKDYSYDKIHHPERVLQKGGVSLKHLGVLGVFCVIFQGLSNYFLGDIINVYWWCMFLWTLMMAKEFFIGDWLRKHVFWYLISHMIVMIFLCLWILSFYNFTLLKAWPAILLVFAGSVLYELTRKTRGLDENKELDSYPKEIGYGSNSILLFFVAVLVIVFKVLSVKMSNIDYSLWHIADALVLLGYLYTVFKMLKVKSSKVRKLMEAQYGSLMMVVYLGFILKSVF